MRNMPDPNTPLCECHLLERMAQEPSVPIAFDAALNEYNITTAEGGTVRIYHCFFCGGRAPESRRDSLFHHVTEEELQRLSALTKELRTVPALEAAFGKPDRDDPSGYKVTRPERAGSPPSTEIFRMLSYDRLSPVATVDAIVGPDGALHFTFMPKAVEPPPRPEPPAP